MKFTLPTILLSLLLTIPALGDDLALSDIEGLWELIEWHQGDVVLIPPQIGGRFSLVGGTILFLVHRELEGDVEYLYGYGPYSIDGNEYRYGYDYFVEVLEKGGDRQTWSGPVEATSYVSSVDGTQLTILDVETGTSGLLLDGNRMTWMKDSKPLRVYERVRN